MIKSKKVKGILLGMSCMLLFSNGIQVAAQEEAVETSYEKWDQAEESTEEYSELEGNTENSLSEEEEVTEESSISDESVESSVSETVEEKATSGSTPENCEEREGTSEESLEILSDKENALPLATAYGSLNLQKITSVQKGQQVIVKFDVNFVEDMVCNGEVTVSDGAVLSGILLPEGSVNGKCFIFAGSPAKKSISGQIVLNIVKTGSITLSVKVDAASIDNPLHCESFSKSQTMTSTNPAKPIVGRIVYYLRGGKNASENPATYECPLKMAITLKDATRTGYDFKGWFGDADYTVPVKSIGALECGDKYIFAKWNAHKYTIAYKGNGSTSGTMKTLKYWYGSSYHLAKNLYKRKGYTLVGWNTKADGSGTAYAPEAAIKNLSSVDGKQITLYAQWKKVKYKISYKLNKGVQNPKNRTYYYVTTKTFTLKTPTRKGYTFCGWYKNSKYTKAVTKVKQGCASNFKFYAKWKKN